MDNALLVAVDNSVEDRNHQVVYVSLIKLLPLHNDFKELASFHQLHDQAVVALIFVGVDKLDNVRVVNLLQDFDLVLHSGDVFFVHLTLRKNLDSYLVASLSMVSFSHSCEST